MAHYTASRNVYGCYETNPLPDGYWDEKPEYDLPWDSPELVRVERLRLLTDPGYPVWDVSYCTGRDRAGRKVNVILPFSQLPKHAIKREIIRYAKMDRVYAKGLGIFEAISTLC